MSHLTEPAVRWVYVCKASGCACTLGLLLEPANTDPLAHRTELAATVAGRIRGGFEVERLSIEQARGRLRLCPEHAAQPRTPEEVQLVETLWAEEPLEPSRTEYHGGLRESLQYLVARWACHDQQAFAALARAEPQRLDARYGPCLDEERARFAREAAGRALRHHH